MNQTQPKIQNQYLISLKNQHSDSPPPNFSFPQSQITHKILRGFYAEGYEQIDAFQKICLSPFIEGRNLIVQFESTIRKEICYALGGFLRINQELHNLQIIILSFSRERAQSVHRLIQRLGEFTQFDIDLLVGGVNMIDTRRRLKEKKEKERTPHIFVGTPGIMLNFLKRRLINFQNLKTIILDEVDEIFDRYPYDDIIQILDNLPMNIQYCLFSMTITQEILKVKEQYIKNPFRMSARRKAINMQLFKHFHILIKDQEKIAKLGQLCKTYPFDHLVIFTKNKQNAICVSNALQKLGFYPFIIHEYLGNQEEILTEFNAGPQEQILVTSDVLTADGTKDRRFIINYDIPGWFSYHKRIMKCGMQEQKGTILNLVTQEEVEYMKSVENSYNIVIEAAPSVIPFE